MRKRSSELNRSKVGRHPLVQHEVLSHFSNLIYRGELKPGDKLPSRGKLIEQFGSASNTIQRAFDMMINDGFIETLSRSGTFVSERPPCLHHYGLVFPSEMDKPGWRGLDKAMINSAKKMEQNPDITFNIYEGLFNNDKLNQPLAKQLCEDIKLRRLAGVIFSTNPFYLNDWLAVTDPAFPRIAIGTPVDSLPFPIFHFASNDIIKRSVDRLVDQGCKNLAILMHDTNDNSSTEQFQIALAKHRLVYDPSWALGMSLENPQWIGNITRLLMNPNNSRRPDGLIIVDDTLTPHILTGIKDCDCKVPEDLKIISHCNFPQPMMNVTGIERIGFDIAEMMDKALESLIAQRKEYPEDRQKFFELDAYFDTDK